MNEADILQQIYNLASKSLNNTNQITLKEFIINSYIPFQRNAKKEANYRHILGQLNIIIMYDFTNKAIVSITENDIINFFNLLRNDRGITQATQNRYRSTLNHIFNTAMKDKLINNNPVKYIKKFKEQGRDRVLSSDEIKFLLEACKQCRNKELYYIVLVALYTGMRYSNIINMKKSNIKGSIYLLDGNETKSGKEQTIHLHLDLMQELNKHMQKSNDDVYVFKSKYIIDSFKCALLKAGIENFRFHDLRRTFATTLLNNDVDVRTIQNMLGHSTILMTQKYLARDEQKELDAINKLCFI